jgi:DNA-directed RNA polymerase subunit K/omega
MINRPAVDNAFEFVRVSALRAAQLMRGCTARVPVPPSGKAISTAQREVAAGLVRALPRDAAVAHAWDRPALMK